MASHIHLQSMCFCHRSTRTMSELPALPNLSNVERYSVTTPVTSFFSLPHISSARQRNSPFMHIDKLIRSVVGADLSIAKRQRICFWKRDGCHENVPASNSFRLHSPMGC